MKYNRAAAILAAVTSIYVPVAGSFRSANAEQYANAPLPHQQGRASRGGKNRRHLDPARQNRRRKLARISRRRNLRRKP